LWFEETSMTRRRFYAPTSAFSDDQKSVTLAHDEARHARSVLRLQRGDEVFVFDGEGHEYRCAITNLTQASSTLNVIEKVEPARPDSQLNLMLAIALLKGEKFDLVVQKATELGVTSILPVVTSRADVRIRNGQETLKRLARWQRIALEAAKQSGRARLLKVNEPVTFDSLIATPIEDDELRLMFAERDGSTLAELTSNPPPSRVLALVGSEGGFSDEEIAQARAAAWRIITLGGRILRAETAAIVVAALLQHRWGDLV
jgi:16S rRNA (uracil1498-N3)-methyltransferase